MWSEEDWTLNSAHISSQTSVSLTKGSRAPDLTSHHSELAERCEKNRTNEHILGPTPDLLIQTFQGRDQGICILKNERNSPRGF